MYAHLSVSAHTCTFHIINIYMLYVHIHAYVYIHIHAQKTHSGIKATCVSLLETCHRHAPRALLTSTESMVKAMAVCMHIYTLICMCIYIPRINISCFALLKILSVSYAHIHVHVYVSIMASHRHAPLYCTYFIARIIQVSEGRKNVFICNRHTYVHTYTHIYRHTYIKKCAYINS